MKKNFIKKTLHLIFVFYRFIENLIVLPFVLLLVLANMILRTRILNLTSKEHIAYMGNVAKRAKTRGEARKKEHKAEKLENKSVKKTAMSIKKDKKADNIDIKI